MIFSPTIRKSIAECVGTFCLVFAGTGAVIANDVHDGSVTSVGVGLTFGLIVTAMVYSIGGLSGAHINPAVTIAFWVARRFEGVLVLPYILAQCAGALLASVALRVLFPEHEGLGGTIPGGTWSQSFVFEFLLTAILMFVILRVASEHNIYGSIAGLAIGCTVGLEAMFAGPVCGASMNPARSLGPAIVSGQMDSLWIYLVATILGAVAAVGIDAVIGHEADNQEIEA